MKPLLVMVTANHPFERDGGEHMFVAPELERLAADGRVELRLAPLHTGGRRLATPDGVAVDTSLAETVRAHRVADLLLAWRWPGFGAELRRALRDGGAVGVARVWRWAAQARAVWRWAASLPDEGALVGYTYWRGGATLALARLAAERRRCAAMTRVHGYDLYEERFRPPFQPWTGVYRALAMIATVSAHGHAYLRARGVAGERLCLARLGTPAAGARARASDDGTLRVMSCSFLEPLKRVPAVARAMVALACRHPGRTVRWTHLGDGPDRAAVEAALAGAPANLQPVLAGHVAHDEVRAFYGREPVDLFVLLSATEGLPVSVQEALAVGVPVIATDVGGVAEAVDDRVGALLPPSPSDDEVVAALEAVGWGGSPAERAARRDAAHRRWAEVFDAGRNHAAFAARVGDVVEKL